ncbi:MAG TPA: hypothetical protein VGR38_00320 [Candidatus Polarisedimenticolia bacterium]|nr:hypothetical protein [Candidatus Polarisedimenticolia bacterium]
MSAKKKHSKELEKKRESRDAALLKGTEELLQVGVDLEDLEPTVDAVKRLASLPAPSREAQQAVACWLGFAELAEAADLLLAMEGRATDKDLKREIRRSLFRLEQRGVALPAAARSAGPALARETDRGYLSPVDSRGDQVVWFVKEESTGDYFVLSGVVNDRKGLVEADAGRVARPAFRDLVEKTHRRFSLRMLPASAAWCDRLLHEAYKRSTQRRHPGVSRYPSYRMEISHQIPDPMPCPVHALVEGEDLLQRRDLLETSQRLFEEAELSGWSLEAEWVDAHREAFLQATESPLVLSRFQQSERMEAAVREACEAIFAGEARQIYAGRLESMAYYFMLDGRAAAARQALAVSWTIAEGRPLAVGELPFAIELTRRSLSAMAQVEQARKREEQGPSLIVKPGER